MDFAFTADERAFAEEVRRFLRAQPARAVSLSSGMDAGYGSGAHSRAFMRALGARGLALHGLAPRLRRPGAPAVPQARAAGRAGAGRRAVRPAGRLRQTADSIIAYGSERLRARGAAAHRARRRHVLAGLQRARRRLRPAVAQHAGAARRRRLRDPRPQDLVEPRRHRDLRPGARADQRGSAAQPRLQHVRGAPTARRAWTSGRSGA